MCLVPTSWKGQYLSLPQLRWYAAHECQNIWKNECSSFRPLPTSSFYLPGLFPGCWSRSRTGAHVIVGESQNSGRSVVSEVHKHVVVGTAAESKIEMFKEGIIFPPARWCVELFSVCVCFFHSPLQHLSRAAFDLWGIALQHSQEVLRGHVLRRGGKQQHTSQKSKQASSLTLLQNIYVSFIHYLSHTSLV